MTLFCLNYLALYKIESNLPSTYSNSFYEAVFAVIRTIFKSPACSTIFNASSILRQATSILPLKSISNFLSLSLSLDL